METFAVWVVLMLTFAPQTLGEWIGRVRFGMQIGYGEALSKREKKMREKMREEREAARAP